MSDAFIFLIISVIAFALCLLPGHPSTKELADTFAVTIGSGALVCAIVSAIKNKEAR